MDNFLKKTFPDEKWEKEDVKKLPSRNYTLQFTHRTDRIINRVKTYFETHESTITTASLVISFVLVICEAVIVTCLVRRVRRLEDQIFIKSRTIRGPGSPILRRRRTGYPSTTCGYATTHTHGPGSPTNFAETVELITCNGTTNRLPVSAPAGEGNYTQPAIDGPPSCSTHGRQCGCP